MITGDSALVRIFSAGHLASVSEEYFVPERAAGLVPEPRGLIRNLMTELRRHVLYPRPDLSGLRPHVN